MRKVPSTEELPPHPLKGQQPKRCTDKPREDYRNQAHREDFKRLLGRAAKSQKPD